MGLPILADDKSAAAQSAASVQIGTGVRDTYEGMASAAELARGGLFAWTAGAGGTVRVFLALACHNELSISDYK